MIYSDKIAIALMEIQMIVAEIMTDFRMKLACATATLMQMKVDRIFAHTNMKNGIYVVTNELVQTPDFYKTYISLTLKPTKDFFCSVVHKDSDNMTDRNIRRLESAGTYLWPPQIIREKAIEDVLAASRALMDAEGYLRAAEWSTRLDSLVAASPS